jgi:hypothetical protein
MATNKTDRAFKTLLNRRVTSEDKTYFEEIGDFTLNISASEIWAENISSTPSIAIFDSVAEQRTLFELTEDITVGSSQAWYAEESNIRLKDWISDKYGQSYQIKLFDNNNSRIYPTDSSDWIFEYQTGILTFSGDVTGYAQPFKITGYRYIGTKGTGDTEDGYSPFEYINNLIDGYIASDSVSTEERSIAIWDDVAGNKITDSGVYIDTSNKMGIGQSIPSSTLTVAGSIAVAIVTKSIDYSATVNDSVILIDAMSSDRTLSLPLASTCQGRQYNIKKIDATTNKVYISRTSADTIDGMTQRILNFQYQSITVISNGSNWFII